MLKGVPRLISPELLKILSEMGHGDEVVIADGNFPSSSNAQRLVRYDGLEVPEVLENVLKVFPLDTSVEYPVSLMAVSENDDYTPVIWEEFEEILQDSGEENIAVEYIDRFEFYERAKEAYAIIATTESALYANIILKKGVIE